MTEIEKNIAQQYLLPLKVLILLSITGIVDVFVDKKIKRVQAIIATAIISGILLGLFCNFLCFNLDMHFNYFGGADTPKLFIWNGIAMSVAGGAFGGWLLFTERGLKWLKKVGL